MNLDFQEIENYLEVRSNKKTFIHPKELYTIEECKKLNSIFIKFPNSETRNIVKRIDDNLFYNYETECFDCNKIDVVYKKGTQHFYEYIRDLGKENGLYRMQLCNSCRIKRETKLREERELKQKEKDERENNFNRDEETQKFIELFLSTDRAWNDGISPKDKYNSLMNSIRKTHYEIIISYIQSMEYYEFLKTPYWTGIAHYTKMKARYKCIFCNSSYNLVTHHRTYENHGNELFNLDDLVVLCSSCHNSHHKH